MKKLNLKILLLTVIVILVTVTLAGASCLTFTSPKTTETKTTAAVTTSPATKSNISEWTPTINSQASEPLPSIADVVALVKPSVVAINTTVTVSSPFLGPATEEGAGSGWVIDENGIIVTNNHVVEGAESITVTTDNGDIYTADMNSVFTDSLNDLAIIKINTKNLPALKIGDSSRLRVGDWVVAIGNQLGMGISATQGIISQLEVSLQVDMDQTLYDLIKTDAAINPGSSGGPLVNLAGEVIGITSAKIASIGVEGMGYAISIDTALPIIQELVNKGYITRPYLGVSLYTVDQTAISQLKLKVDKGVLIVQVAAGSPADKAGLKQYDVIVSIGGQEVNAVEELTQILHTSTIGVPLEIIYWRSDIEYITTVTPIETPRQ